MNESDILEFLLNRNKKDMLIINEPYQIKNYEFEDINTIIDNQIQNAIKKQRELNIDISDDEIEEIHNTLEETRENEHVKIEEKFKSIVEHTKSLTYLNREINAVEKETGLYELYIGYPFVEGVFKDNTFVKSPLLLFPIKLKNDNNKWYISNIVDQEVLINKVFILGFAKYNNVKLEDFQTEYQCLSDFGEDIVKSILKYLEDNKINIRNSKHEKILNFIEHSAKEKVNYSTGELTLKNYMVLGQFPISNSIYNDYEIFDKLEGNNKLLQNLLTLSNEKDNANIKEIDDNNKLSFSEKDIFILSALDYSQENAVKKANDTDQLVVYGPPGTGKSQTITGIISDALVKNKKVLMVSQKRAALDVIYNRLSDIQSKVVLIHDSNKDKKSFYNKVAQELEHEIQIQKNSLDNVITKANLIDDKICELELIKKFLHDERDYGLNLQQMYSRTKAINLSDKKRYNNFIKFKDKFNLFNWKHQNIEQALKSIKEKEVFEEFWEFQELTFQNSIFEKFNSDFDTFKGYEILNTIDEISLEVQNIMNDMGNCKYKDELKVSYKLDKYELKNETINTLINQINKNENGYLTTPINKNNWWSVKYWLEYKANKMKEEDNKKEFDKRAELIKKDLEFYMNRLNYGLELIKKVTQILSISIQVEANTKFFNNDGITQILSDIKCAIGDYEKYKRLRHKVYLLEDVEKKILEHCYKFSNSQDEYKELFEDILEFSILKKIYGIETSKNCNEKLLSYTRFSDITSDVRNLMNEKNSYTRKLIMECWSQNIVKHLETNIFKEFKRQANKKRMLWPIRKYFSEFQDTLTDLLPCWLMSPETVSEVMPLANDMFDIIIFDEASQMFIENAIPTIYRGKKVIIAGDDKQLKPNASFSSKYDELNEDELTIENSAALEEESLLDLAKVKYECVHLNYHYRSKYDELINFSNYAFYSGRLQVSPNIRKSDSDITPISRIKVDGVWINRQNEKEAKTVVELVSDILKTRQENETIGIITFNATQKDLIEDMLEENCYKDSNFKALYSKEIDREDGDEDVSMFVKNIENVQGDERDIIIFSTGYAKNENGRVSVNFGSLSQDGGENRLNVAISRAKRQIHIITSIEPEELSVDGTKNLGPKLLKKYLQYVRAVSNKDKDEANSILNSLVDSNMNRKEEAIFDSGFEKEVYEALRSKGYDVDTQIGVSGYKIDLGIYDRKTSRYILGIECDGSTYHSSKSARERDIHRQRYLESRGWKIIRIWSRDWWNNSTLEIEKIRDLVERDGFEKIPNCHEMR